VKPLATFYPAATPATTYLRCQLPAKHLPAALCYEQKYQELDDRIVFPTQEGDTAIFQLAGDRLMAAITHHMMDQGIRVLVETDDNYRQLAPKHVRDRSGWGIQIGEKDHTLKGHAYICRHADGVIVTTKYLADAYKGLNPNVYVCPNTVDPDDWPARDDRDDGVLRIGWVASRSHWEDAKLVSRALDWASRQPDVEVWNVGLDPGWKFRREQIEWIPDLASYRACFRLLDIGVAPVKSTPFGLGRSDVKWLEYTMGGAATVVSDNAPYSDVPDHLCLKAKDAGGFLRAVQHLVKHRDEVKQLAQEAGAYVLKERTTAAQIGCWRDAIAA
jgi:hypothetical protein